MLLNDSIQVHVDEVLPWCGATMAQQHGLYMIERQRLAQQRVVAQVNLPDGEVVGRAPLGIHAVQEILGYGLGCGHNQLSWPDSSRNSTQAGSNGLFGLVRKIT